MKGSSCRTFSFIAISFFCLGLFLCYFWTKQTASFFEIKNKKTYVTAEELETSLTKQIDYLLIEDNAFEFILTLPGGIVINEGGIITQEGYIVQSTQTGLGDQYRLLNPDQNLSSANSLYFNGKLVVISSAGSENWYHWLLQILPRLIILKTSKKDYDRIYINNLQYSWQKTSLLAVLSYLNISENKLLLLNGDIVLKAKELIVPSIACLPNKTKWLPKWTINSLRDIFIQNTSLTTNSHFDKIYVSRAKASSRKILNEPELLSLIEPLGFKIIYLEDLSPFEQADLFNHAKIIVTPHGSALANLVFCKAGCNILEIIPEYYPAQLYRRISSDMKCSYTPINCEMTDDENLKVDIKSLQEALIAKNEVK